MNFLRVILIKLLAWESSVIINCNLNNCCASVNGDGCSLIADSTFDNSKKPKERKQGITILPIKKGKKSAGITVWR